MERLITTQVLFISLSENYDACIDSLQYFEFTNFELVFLRLRMHSMGHILVPSTPYFTFFE